MHPLLLQQHKVDLIGDIHGCYEPLLSLLERLGYQKQTVSERSSGFSYVHSEGRLVVFVGDLIDRGPQVREVVSLVRTMVESGHALMVLGNHEFNAIVYCEEVVQHLELMSRYQKHSDIIDRSSLPERLQRLMSATLEQFVGRIDEWRSCCEWFKSLPLFLEGETFRVVHACWDSSLIDQLRKDYPNYRMDDAFYTAAKSIGTIESLAVDRLTRGTNMPLPAGMKLIGQDGVSRNFFRAKFWAEKPQTYGDIVFQPDPLPYDLAEKPIDDCHHQQLVYYPKDALPVFFGHYWLKGEPKPLLENIACLDYSAVHSGRLIAYTYSGEKPLRKENFVWVNVD